MCHSPTISSRPNSIRTTRQEEEDSEDSEGSVAMAGSVAMEGPVELEALAATEGRVALGVEDLDY